MERQLPKNVRQIGNVCDEPKIYVEDYVDTFLGQLQEKAMEKPVAAALTGEITKCEDKVVVYISGAIRAEDVEVEGTNLKISEEIWEKNKEKLIKLVSGWLINKLPDVMAKHNVEIENIKIIDMLVGCRIR